ncbi:PREDICTED: chitinase-3-like protein 1 [Wasmannia auropunctata]|uniref:chitinase-3-like protein 1 n=1 Tax=Wasmannia auropunctata TaxID=64793 RepID=UPI0005EE5B8E|nr:PREDICTED: chitinase-3-like protein 1 [Wasmannia auropunctata]XP_011706929.1 PREDICTED: chitinase-3-like protein 1 [Wasmannia auropunctata]
MNRWILVFAALAALSSAADSGKKIVCYFGSWAVYRPSDGKFDISYIQPKLCTHLIYAFVGISQEGKVVVLDAWQDLPDNSGKDGFGRFNKLREQSPETKTLIAIGGWNEGSAKFSAVVADPTTRARFVKDIVDFVKKYKFDGFDVDWEYPCQRDGKPEDKHNYISLLKELRTEFDKHGLILSAAVAAAESSASQSYDISAMSKYLDFINIMAYDFHGAWEPVTGHNAPLYPRKDESEDDRKLNVDASVHYWLRNGCPPEKLILGVPFYGRAFTLADTNQHGLGAPITGPGTAGPYTREGGMLGYNEICESFKQGGWTVARQEEHRTPYAYKGDQWVGYDDVTSFAEKTAYINSLGLGGAMVWSIETDDFLGTCGEKYPLLKTLNARLRRQVPIELSTKQPSQTTQSPRTTQPPVTASPSGICKKEGFVRDQKDCSIFYRCLKVDSGYKIYEFSCGSGLAFDPEINNCNFKNLVPGCN